MPRPPEIPELTPDGAAIVPLTKGKVALVDVADYQRMRMFSWHAWRSPAKSHEKWYGNTFIYLGDRQTYHTSLHVVLLGCVRDMEVDHIDGNSLNNRRSNLRFVTHAQNMLNTVKPRRKRPSPNTSQYKGVSYDRRVRGSKPWFAQLRYQGSRFYLGAFDNEVDAAKAYDNKAKEIFGTFARLNFPEAS